MKTIVYNINKKFEGPQNGLFVRERERESFYLPVSKTKKGFDLNGFQFIIERGKSDALFAADFLFLNMNDPRLPHKDDVFDDEPQIGNPNDDLLEKVEETSEGSQTEP